MDSNQSMQKDKDLIINTFRDLETRRELSSFLEDLLTEDEFLDLAQRIKIVKMILDDKTYDEIAEKVGTSTATVSKIGQVIKYGKGAFKRELGGEKK